MSIRPQNHGDTNPSTEGGFLGFKPLQSNTTYCPNQFFDVCLPHYSRGCTRIVGYMIRRTLGWCDADGNPQESQIKISWSELIKRAKVSRGSLGPALKEALDGKFIVCSRAGRQKTKGADGASALYELNWDETTSHYEKDPDEFLGFYAHGQGGNRTDIPNQYFDIVLPDESLAVTKLVGVIMRYSIGFQNNTGARRQRVALAYSQICKRVNISSRTTVSTALKTAIGKNFIHQIVKGGISKDRETQITSVYGVKWTDADEFLKVGSENGPEKSDVLRASVQKVDQPKSADSSKNGLADRSKNRTSNDSKSGPVRVQELDQRKGSKSGLNKTKILKKTLLNDNLKQPQDSEPAVAEEFSVSISLLTSAGFDEIQAEQIAKIGGITAEVIEQQIEWLDARNPRTNKLGLLRKAIEGNWDPPEERPSIQTDAYRFAQAFYTRVDGPRQAWEEPSRNDLKFGASFLEALELGEEPEVTGECFGKFCESNKMDFPSLTASLRTEGKAFLASEKKREGEQRRKNKKREEAEQEILLKEKEKAWHKFLWAQEAKIKQTRPADYESFLQARQKARSVIEAENKDDKIFAKILLKMHDSEEARISELQRFFAPDLPSLQEFEE